MSYQYHILPSYYTPHHEDTSTSAEFDPPHYTIAMSTSNQDAESSTAGCKNYGSTEDNANNAKSKDVVDPQKVDEVVKDGNKVTDANVRAVDAQAINKINEPGWQTKQVFPVMFVYTVVLGVVVILTTHYLHWLVAGILIIFYIALGYWLATSIVTKNALDHWHNMIAESCVTIFRALGCIVPYAPPFIQDIIKRNYTRIGSPVEDDC